MPLNSRVQQRQDRATGGLSTQHDTAAEAVEAQAEDAGLCARALPLAEDGGLAFPRGVMGRAYRLEAAAFERYCATEGARERRAQALEARTYGFRDMRLLACGFAVVMLLRFLPTLINGSGLPAAPVYGAVTLFCLGFLAHRALRAPGWFTAAFPEARALSFLEQWTAMARLDRSRHGLAAFWYRALRILAPLFIAGTAALVEAEDAALTALMTALLILSALEALLALVFLYVYLPTRLGPASKSCLQRQIGD